MVGILLVSHGAMAEGMRDSLTMFFGEHLEQLDTMRLRMDTNADEFGIEMAKKVEALDSGDGVIIFADVLGGTPCNQAMRLVSDRVHLITGMNLPMLMEFLTKREEPAVIQDIVESGKNAVMDAGALLLESANEEPVDDD